MATATTELDVVNRALVKLGQLEISSLSDAGKVPRVMSNMVDPVRDRFLRENAWNAAVHRATLSPDATSPEWGWDYRYLLPSDFLKMVTVESGSSTGITGLATDVNPAPVRYVIEGEYILTDESSNLRIKYVRRLEDISRWDSLMIESLATLYACEACMAITGDIQLKDMLYREYMMQVMDAKKHDGWEDPVRYYPVDDYISVRH